MRCLPSNKRYPNKINDGLWNYDHFSIWLAFSPNLRHIEDLWDQVGRRVVDDRQRIRKRLQLIQALIRELEAILQYKIQRLIRRMRHRYPATLVLMEYTLVIEACDFTFKGT